MPLSQKLGDTTIQNLAQVIKYLPTDNTQLLRH